MKYRSLELAVTCSALLVFAIPMLVAASTVWLVLGRPVLFSQVRAGCRGVPFSVFKFRTMDERRDTSGNLLPDAERQTPVTSLLRRSRLDELPQLLAVLQGHMALVGPRPLWPETVAMYGKLGELRCSIRPGLTGWSQVSGNTRLSEDEKIALDLWYVEHRSASLDLQILIETVGVVLFGERRRGARIAQAIAHVETISPEIRTAALVGSGQ